MMNEKTPTIAELVFLSQHININSPEFDDLCKSLKRQGEIAAYKKLVEHWRVGAFISNGIKSIILWCEAEIKKLEVSS